jgi:hypothetical protein
LVYIHKTNDISKNVDEEEADPESGLDRLELAEEEGQSRVVDQGVV